MADARKEPGGKELWKSFIDMHEDLELLESGKCRCKLTGHEMMPVKEVVEAHLSGKRYKKEKAKAAANKFDFEQFAPHIVQSKKDSRKLFCHLTKTHLNKVPEEIELHVNGRRFKLRKQEREARDAMRAKRKKKPTPGEGNEEEDPLLDQFKGFDSAESEEDEDEDEDEEDDEEEAPRKGKRRPLMPAIGNVDDGDDNEDFEEVEAAQSSDEEADGEEGAEKGKQAWPVPEFKMFGKKDTKEKKRKADPGAKGDAKKAKTADEDTGSAQTAPVGNGTANKHHGRGEGGAKAAGKHHGRGTEGQAKASAPSAGSKKGKGHKGFGKQQAPKGQRAGRA